MRVTRHRPWAVPWWAPAVLRALDRGARGPGEGIATRASRWLTGERRLAGRLLPLPPHVSPRRPMEGGRVSGVGTNPSPSGAPKAGGETNPPGQPLISQPVGGLPPSGGLVSGV